MGTMITLLLLYDCPMITMITQYIYIYIMTEYTSSKSVSTTVFINLFSLTKCPSYSDKIKCFLYYNIKLQ